MNNDILNEIKQLTRQLNDWAYAYYVQDDPQVPDSIYDESLKKLIRLESDFPQYCQPDSPSFRTGAPPRDSFQKHRHLQPMLSLANAFTLDEVQKFFERAQRYLKSSSSFFECTVEEKMDGLALSLTYEKGLLTCATTRGDGEEGEIVTENIRTIPEIPLRLRSTTQPPNPLPEILEVRGEVYMDHQGFQNLNDALTTRGQKLFANPRNAAAGSIRLLDSKITAERPLKFFAYQIVGTQQKTQSLVLKELLKMGFRVNPHHFLIRSFEKIAELIERYEKKRKEGDGDYDIDGLVIKIDDLEIAEKLGSIANSPRSALAFKLSPLEGLTQILKIETQVGRTGALTPVAHLKPLSLSGVVVSKATLHNEEQIRIKDVRVKDFVWVRRAGDVIPEVVRVDLSLRPSHTQAFSMPTECPSCQSRLEADKSSLRCMNSLCPAKKVEILKHFCSRHAMDIRGLGDQKIEKYFHLGLLLKRSDIYRLKDKKEMLISLEGSGEKSIQNILAAIEASKKQSPARLLFALGIDLVGESTAEELIKHCASLLNVFSWNEEKLAGIPHIGPETIASLRRAAQDKELQKELEELKELGLHEAFKKQNPPSEIEAGPLKGLQIVITGSLSKSRDEIKKELKKLGAFVTDTVSSKTNYLIAGEKAGSKLQKATKLGVPILGEKELSLLLQGPSLYLKNK